MSNDEIMHLAKKFLELKSKAVAGIRWTEQEQATVDQSLQGGNTVSVLAACCVLSSERPKDRLKSFAIIRSAFENQTLPPYVELSVYEALTHVDYGMLAPYCDLIVEFVRRSLAKRAVNLDNTIFVLGTLARGGEPTPMDLLRELTNDGDSGVQQNATLILNGIEQAGT